MILIALVIGTIVVIAAIRNSQASLASALMQDVPAYVTWGAAILAIGAIGYIKPLSPVSRALMALVITVLILKNYQAILGGFASAWQSPPAASGGTGGMDGSGTGNIGALGSLLPNLGSGSASGTGAFGGGGSGSSGFVDSGSQTA